MNKHFHSNSFIANFVVWYMGVFCHPPPKITPPINSLIISELRCFPSFFVLLNFYNPCNLVTIGCRGFSYMSRNNKLP